MKIVSSFDYVNSENRPRWHQPAPAVWDGRESGAGGAVCPVLLCVGVGDLAELIQDLVEQCEVAGAQVGFPLREDLVECGRPVRAPTAPIRS